MTSSWSHCAAVAVAGRLLLQSDRRERGIFVKWSVASESAARIAVADFDGDGRLDFATIGYSVAGYYEAPNPRS
jgi:hypothetical protein